MSKSLNNLRGRFAAVVSHDPWAAIAFTMDNAGWGSFGDDAEVVYAELLGYWPVETVAAAIRDLAVSGRKFYPRPSVSDIAAECRRIAGGEPHPADFHAPSWVEIHMACDDAAFRHRNRKAQAVELVREKCGPVAADWFAAGGRDQFLASVPAAELGRGYESYVRSRRDAAAKGIT